VARLGQLVGIVERVVEAARFLAAARALDHEVRHEREVAELEEVAGDLEVEVVLADLVAKDLELITGLGERLGAPMRQAMTSLEVVRSAIAAGYGERDLSQIAVFLRGGEG